MTPADNRQRRAGTTLAGIGLDLAPVAFFRARPSPTTTTASHAAFYALTFTPSERVRCAAAPDPPAAFAGCFAAKEATVKALGAAGIPAAVPQIEVAGGTARIVSRRGEPVPAEARELAVTVRVEIRDEVAVARAAAYRRRASFATKSTVTP